MYSRLGEHFDLQLAKIVPLDAPTSSGNGKLDQTPLEFAHQRDIFDQCAENLGHGLYGGI